MSRDLGVSVAALDSLIHRDDRVIPNLLGLQTTSIPPFDYFVHLQRDIQPFMRKIVTSWMLEVCDEQKCEQQVFPLAINYMDRFLCTTSISREQLQLLGVACLLLASKIRQCYNLSVDLLCAYTDNGVTPDQVRTWELLVLSRLQWDLCGVTAYDFVEQIIQRLAWCKKSDTIRHHAHTLVSVCYTETFSIGCLPSLLAAACVCAAAIGLKLINSKPAVMDICRLTNAIPTEVEIMIQNVEIIIAKETEAFIAQQFAKKPEIAYSVIPVYEMSYITTQIAAAETREVC